jgi:hypothetical protein
MFRPHISDLDTGKPGVVVYSFFGSRLKSAGQPSAKK